MNKQSEKAQFTDLGQFQKSSSGSPTQLTTIIGRILSALILTTAIIIIAFALVTNHTTLNVLAVLCLMLLAVIGCLALMFLLYPQSPIAFVHSDNHIDFTIADNLDDAIIITDKAGLILTANQHFKTEFPHSPYQSIAHVFQGFDNAETIFYRLQCLALAGQAAFEEIYIKNENARSYGLTVKPLIYNNKKKLFWQLRQNLAKNQISENKGNLATTPQQNIEKAVNFQQFIHYFQESPTALALINATGVFQQCNKAFAKLMTIRTIEQLKLVDLINQADQSRLQKTLDAINMGKKSSALIETHCAKDEARHIQLYFHKIIDGEITNKDNTHEAIAIVTAIETTEQKSLEDKMAHGQKMQAVGQLAGGIAHDFNNVLTAILISCDLLLASHRSSDPAHADLMNIKHNVNRAAALVQQLLAFSRRQTLQPEIIDLTDLLSDVRNLLMPLLGNNIILKFSHGRDLWPVEVDQASLQRVLMNLVINARDAMPKGGNITISTTNFNREKSEKLNYIGFKAGDYVELSVKDTGTGIAKSVQEQMFEPFFTTKEVGKGTGLGLSMVYGIVKQSGGYIYCDSEEGNGTVFRIFLPRYIVEKATEPAIELQKTQPNKQSDKNADLSGSATVLLVEDEDAVRMGGVRALQSRGYQVLEACNGVEALEKLEEKNGKIDIIVSDVVMPEMDGPTLLNELRKKHQNIKFVFVSGYAKDAFAKNLPEDAVFGFLPKPFTLKQLALKVKETLEQE